MAGSGDLGAFRLLRELRWRVDAEVTYGDHMALHMAIGACVGRLLLFCVRVWGCVWMGSEWLVAGVGIFVDAHVTNTNTHEHQPPTGFLFLGGGRAALSRSNEAIAALVAATFPRLPAHTSDNQYALQVGGLVFGGREEEDG